MAYCLKIIVGLKFDGELSIVFGIQFYRKISKSLDYILLRRFFLQSVNEVQWNTEIFFEELNLLVQLFLRLSMDNIQFEI